MKTIILAGGLGTRLQEETQTKPKPMVEIGKRPLLWHILEIYAYYEHRNFILALGYRGEIIREYFHRYRGSWTVSLVDTGLDTQTGGRLKRLSDHIQDSTFMATYGDGVANINIDKLLAFHRQHGRLATVTAVHAPSRFGGLMLNGNRVEVFKEKQQEGWINGGFFVFEPGIFRYIEDDSTVLEQGPLETLAKEGLLMAYKHEGFWQCMDTLRDVHFLQNLWETQKAPWVMW